MSVIQFPNSNRPEKQKVLGNICFNWRDIEFVEASKSGKTILHFASGKTYVSNIPFDEGRKRYLNHRKTSGK